MSRAENRFGEAVVEMRDAMQVDDLDEKQAKAGNANWSHV